MYIGKVESVEFSCSNDDNNNISRVPQMKQRRRWRRSLVRQLLEMSWDVC